MEADSWRTLSAVSNREGPTVVFKGKRCVNLSSNDYLGLASNKPLLGSFLSEGQAPSLDEHGMAGTSARLLAGNHAPYERLENDLSELFGGRPALVFNSGYHANLGMCSGLADRKDVFFADKLCHASIIDGMRLSGAELVRYHHLDVDHLESLLKKHRGQHRNAFVVTESVFSMDGDVPDLARIVKIKEDHDATLILDEAHAVGVLGPKGLGIAASLGLLDGVDILVGTFGKALGSYGAFAICGQNLREFLVNKARSFIFTTALPPAVLNWSRLALSTAVAMDRERTHLAGLWRRLRETLTAAGARTGGDTQIVPVHIGESAKAVQTARLLQESGFLALPIRPPTVPPGTARLRLSLTANMKWEHIAGLPDILAAARRQD